LGSSDTSALETPGGFDVSAHLVSIPFYFLRELSANPLIVHKTPQDSNHIYSLHPEEIPVIDIFYIQINPNNFKYVK
jgi:hypothetical protein